MGLLRVKDSAPLYVQLENILRGKIENGEYAPGDILPSEKQMQEHFGVSRITVRQAVGDLVNEGYLKCAQGVGTTVVFEKIDENLQRVISFSEEMARHGVRMETRSCSISRVKASRRVAAKLDIPQGEQCCRLVRVRCAKGSPLVYSITFLKDSVGLPMDPGVYRDSLYLFLEKEFGIRIVKGQDTFEAVPASQAIAAFLEIPVCAPVFKRTRKTTDQDNQAVEYTICYYPGDKYKYSMEY